MTVEINSDPWATLDELMGVEVVEVRRAVGRVGGGRVLRYRAVAVGAVGAEGERVAVAGCAERSIPGLESGRGWRGHAVLVRQPVLADRSSVCGSRR